MFESSGKLDEAFYRETWWQMFGRRNKLSLIFAMSPIIAAAALMVYWRTYSHLWLPALLLLALFVYTWRFVARRRRLSQERLREINGVPESSLETRFGPEGVQLHNPESGARVVLPYETISHIHETSNYLLLHSRSGQVAVAFKGPGLDQDGLVAFLKAQPTAIRWKD